MKDVKAQEKPKVFGATEVRVYFPENGISCKNCWLCVDDQRMKQRRICSISCEVIWDINHIGNRCPLELREDEA